MIHDALLGAAGGTKKQDADFTPNTREHLSLCLFMGTQLPLSD